MRVAICMMGVVACSGVLGACEKRHAAEVLDEQAEALGLHRLARMKRAVSLLKSGNRTDPEVVWARHRVLRTYLQRANHSLTLRLHALSADLKETRKQIENQELINRQRLNEARRQALIPLVEQQRLTALRLARDDERQRYFRAMSPETEALTHKALQDLLVQRGALLNRSVSAARALGADIDLQVDNTFESLDRARFETWGHLGDARVKFWNGKPPNLAEVVASLEPIAAYVRPEGLVLPLSLPAAGSVARRSSELAKTVHALKGPVIVDTCHPLGLRAAQAVARAMRSDRSVSGAKVRKCAKQHTLTSSNQRTVPRAYVLFVAYGPINESALF